MPISRRKQREIVMQSLYMYGVHKGDVSIQYLIETSCASYEEAELAYAMELLKKAIDSQDEIFDLLYKCFRGDKTIKDVQPIDKAILWVAIVEMMYFSVEPKVVINEAIEISKKYSSDMSFKFINGILETIMVLLEKTSHETNE